MKADIPLAERRRLERAQQAEIRAMLAPRHFATMHEQMAIDAALFYLELENFKRAAPVINAMLARLHPDAVAMPAPVVTTPLESATATLPLAARSGAPDMPFDLRSQLGLR